MIYPFPTPEGLRRYPETQGYFPDRSQEGAHPDLDLPCTCTVECEARCAGDCGCEACTMQFHEFADHAGYFHHPDDGQMDVEAANEAYRKGG
ncbi:MAG TPA: hypothetical protein VGU03_10785 [Frateuria sp.]|uniref:hypothetical protein n=1 Tax=Frateuria sp. TaxID=2211372 RepID=UPI002DE652C7|nr:hypothetical protein [Frateuria sp.]